MIRIVWRWMTIILFLCIGLPGFGEEGVTVTQENGAKISIGQDTLVEMQTSDQGEETYVLTPSDPAGLARVTISSIEKGKLNSSQPPTKATGKKITIWLNSGDKTNQNQTNFLIEGEGRVLQGTDSMYGPKSIQFKDSILTILGTDTRDGELLYTLDNGRRIDWKGQAFQATFRLDKNGQYLFKGFKTPNKVTHLNFLDPRLKGGMAHLIPTGKSAKTKAKGPGRKVTPAQ